MLPTQSYGPNTTVTVKVLGNAYILRKVLKDNTKGLVIRGLYFKRTGWIGRCVLKEGRRGAFLDEHGRDMYARIQWQRELHENLEPVLPLPKLIDCFEEAGSMYLVLQYIAGQTLLSTMQALRKDLHWQYQSPAGRRALLHYFLQVVQAIQRMHQKGYIHRDITATNFLVKSRHRVYMIDLELAYSSRFNDPVPAFTLGTYGYMSPSQAQQQAPVPEDDIYSLGALLVLLTTGFEPLRIIEENGTILKEKLGFFMVGTLAQAAFQCLQPDKTQRPSLDTLAKMVAAYQHPPVKSNTPPAGKISPATLEEVIQKGIHAILCNHTMVKDGRWYSEDAAGQSKEAHGAMPKAVYGGFSRGLSGVLYLLAKAKQAGFGVMGGEQLVDQAVAYLQEDFIHRPGVSAGFHFGKAGAAVGLAAVMAGKLTSKVTFDHALLQACLTGPSSWLSLAHGAAGQAAATLLCQQLLMTNPFEPTLRSYIDLLLAQQQKEGSWKIPIHDQGITRSVKHVSFAYGNAGILWVLLSYYQVSQYAPAAQAAIKGLHWLRRQYAPTAGNYSWCDGGPGIAQAFIKAAVVFTDPVYKAQAEKILATIPEGITLVNLSWCHGITGLGDVYLDAFEAWGEDHWLQQATWIANVLLQLKKTPNAEQHYWLVENRDYPTADLLVGNGGILHFLIRYYLQGQ